MKTWDWPDLLARWNDELKRVPLNFMNEPGSRGVSLHTGASLSDIQALERLLGKELPPSYRSFLEYTDGCGLHGATINSLFSTREVGRFDELDPEWVDAYVGPSEEYLDAGIELVPDEQYFDYSAAQHTALIRVQYFETAIQVSSYAWNTVDAVFLLVPEVINAAGEWEAWSAAHWKAGAHRYQSFYEMMEAELDVLANRNRTLYSEH